MTRRILLIAIVAIALPALIFAKQARQAPLNLPQANALPPGKEIVLHEWGTFTSLQNEAGDAIGGINSDDEELPGFCHNIDWSLIHNPGSKFAPRYHPEITMRLETPVLYFHLPEDVKPPIGVDVAAAFKGGWLTQFYPDAAAEVNGMKVDQEMHPGQLNTKTTGTLSWRRLLVGTNLAGPETTSNVWLAPRSVSASAVTTPKGESEQYLFYRGVGHLNAPIRVMRNGEQLRLCSQLSEDFDKASALAVKWLWLVDVRDDGSCAFRRLNPMTITRDGEHIVQSTPASFAPSDYRGLGALRNDMHEALLDDGLFADEATALLNTWETSYFKSPGLRLFFIVPRRWTDHYLPLSISAPAKITRTMVGRIEIVTPDQRDMMQSLGSLFGQPGFEEQAARLYRNIGRFRDALILDELKSRPTTGLKNFAKVNEISYATR